MKRVKRWGGAAGAALIATVVVAGCGGESGSGSPGEAAAEAESWATPESGYAALEEALREGGPPVRIPFDIVAEGAVSASLVGSLSLGSGGEARLEAAGDFAGRQIDVVLISDGDMMFSTGAPDGVPTPPALRSALGIGFTRMGVLHNLARLSGGAPPDHAEGGVEEWVTVANTNERDMLIGVSQPALLASTKRAITVAGQPSGTFALELDGRTPKVRRQLVEFPQGIMRVTERYAGVEFDAGTFDTTPLDFGR